VSAIPAAAKTRQTTEAIKGRKKGSGVSLTLVIKVARPWISSVSLKMSRDSRMSDLLMSG
jgi:hypothetical protein